MDEKNIQKMQKNDLKTPKRKRKKLISPPKKRKKSVKMTEKVVELPQNPQKETTKKKKYVSKKRQQRRNRFILIFSLVMTLVLTLSILSVTVFFPIKSINIDGCNIYDSKEISTVIGVVKGDNLLLVNESRANSAVKEEYPYIRNIKFNRKLPFTLQVSVEEYEIYSQIRFSGGYLRVGNDGKVLEINKKYKKGSPVITGVSVENAKVGEIVEIRSGEDKENIFYKIEEITNAFDNSKIGGVTLINFEDMQDIKVTYNDKIVMLLGSSSNMDKKLAHAKATLELRGENGESGTLNLSRIPSAKNEASFIPRELLPEEKAQKHK